MKYISLIIILISIILTGCGTVDKDSFDSPTNLELREITDGKVKIVWSYSSQSTKLEYHIARKQGEAEWEESFGTSEDKEFIDEIPVNSFDVYSYKIRVYDTDDESYTAFSEPVAFFPNLSQPSTITLTQISQKYIEIEWSDNSLGEDGFKIDRKVGAESWQTSYKSLPANTSTFVDSVETLYDEVNYRVYAFVGDSYSDKISSHLVPSFPAPVNVVAEQVAVDQIRLQWEDFSEGEEGFGIERKIGLGEWELLTTISNANLEWIDQVNFDTGSVSYRIYAFQGELFSAYSGVVTINLNIKDVSTTPLDYNAYDIEIANNLAFIAADFNGVEIYDISNQQNPELRATIPVSGRTISVSVQDTIMVVGNHNGGINAYSINDLDNIYSLGFCQTYGEPNDIIATKINTEFYAIVADGNSGILIVKINNGAIPNPIIVKTINTNGSAKKIEFQNNKIYVADGDNGLIIIDVSDNLDLSIAETNNSSYLNAIAVSENKILGTTGDQGVKVFSANGNISLNYDSYGYSDLIRADEDYAYFYDVDRGIIVVDIHNLENLTEVAALEQENSINSIHINNSFLYCVGANVLKIIQIIP